MNSASASWMVIALMAFCANFPYFSESIFGFFRPKQAPKSAFIRIVELLVLYFLVLAVAYAIESSIGNAFPQGWQFYAVTVCLYLVLGFPGFVHRYLRRRAG
ncbi:MAG: DUF2818 family protein [Oxalobacteraceae bacterium]|nr:DUF2818 family protein [Oxalobacteraceae bacterium]